MINEHGLYENWLTGYKAGALDADPHGVKWFKSQVDEIKANHHKHKEVADGINVVMMLMTARCILRMNNHGKIADRFDSITSAAKATGIDLSSICQ